MTGTLTLDDWNASVPGVYDNIPNADYHAHKGSLSASGAKLLIEPSCPAKFRQEQETPTFKGIWDFGTVAHGLVLGKPDPFEVLPFANWTTKAAKEAREDARAEGKAPILAKDYVIAKTMAEVVAADPKLGPLFTEGKAEVSLMWTDEKTGIVRRSRPDWMRASQGKRLVFVDYKTAASSEPVKFGKSAADFGYCAQAATAVDGAITLGLDPDPLFVFVAQEKDAPYIVTGTYATDEVLQIGRYLSRKALRTYAECLETGIWPGYADDLVPLELPYWYTRNFEDLIA